MPEAPNLGIWPTRDAGLECGYGAEAAVTAIAVGLILLATAMRWRGVKGARHRLRGETD